VLPGIDIAILCRSSRTPPQSTAALSGLRSIPKTDIEAEQDATERPANVKVEPMLNYLIDCCVHLRLSYFCLLLSDIQPISCCLKFMQRILMVV